MDEQSGEPAVESSRWSLDRKVSVGGSVTALVGFVLKWQTGSGVGTVLGLVGSLVFLVGFLARDNRHRAR